MGIQSIVMVIKRGGNYLFFWGVTGQKIIDWTIEGDLTKDDLGPPENPEHSRLKEKEEEAKHRLEEEHRTHNQDRTGDGCAKKEGSHWSGCDRKSPDNYLINC